MVSASMRKHIELTSELTTAPSPTVLSKNFGVSSVGVVWLVISLDDMAKPESEESMSDNASNIAAVSAQSSSPQTTQIKSLIGSTPSELHSSPDTSQL